MKLIESMKCAVCGKDAVEQIGSMLYCPEHAENMKARLNPRKLSEKCLEVTEEEAMNLLAARLISKRTYVYFALRIDGYHTEEKDLKIQSFCQKWGLSMDDLVIALASLSKKGIVSSNFKQIAVRAYTRAERMKRLEDAANN